jgi:hypothetical protein
MSPTPRSGTLAANDRRSGLGQVSRWRAAIHVSVALWVAMAAGNVALFTVRPASHWPVLEAVEACQVASLIPIALLLDRVNRGSSASRAVTLIGIVAMSVAVAIDVGFVTELAAFGVGAVGGSVFVTDFLIVLLWLLAANALAWQGATLPRTTALLGMATAITATLLYPVWASQLASAVADPAPDDTKLCPPGRGNRPAAKPAKK